MLMIRNLLSKSRLVQTKKFAMDMKVNKLVAISSSQKEHVMEMMVAQELKLLQIPPSSSLLELLLLLSFHKQFEN